VGKTVSVGFNVELEVVELVVDSFDVFTVDEAVADELICPELVVVNDPLEEVDEDAVEVTSLAEIEVTARI